MDRISQVDIQGWFTFQDTYERLAASVPKDGLFIEIGCLRGSSAAWIATRIKLIPGARFVTIDCFCADGNPGYETALRNLAGCGVLKECCVIKMDSVAASDLFFEGAANVVFVDGGHSYEQVKADIAAWTPKISPDGILAGHDYNDRWPGVIQAVDEAFGGEVEITSDGCWIRRL
jgi:predicted O-methyltransferase YrrM